MKEYWYEVRKYKIKLKRLENKKKYRNTSYITRTYNEIFFKHKREPNINFFHCHARNHLVGGMVKLNKGLTMRLIL